jgi:hypothetical protein
MTAHDTDGPGEPLPPWDDFIGDPWPQIWAALREDAVGRHAIPALEAAFADREERRLLAICIWRYRREVNRVSPGRTAVRELADRYRSAHQRMERLAAEAHDVCEGAGERLLTEFVGRVMRFKEAAVAAAQASAAAEEAAADLVAGLDDMQHPRSRSQAARARMAREVAVFFKVNGLTLDGGAIGGGYEPFIAAVVGIVEGIDGVPHQGWLKDLMAEVRADMEPR